MRVIEITEEDKDDIVEHGRQSLKHLKKMIELFMEREATMDDEDEEEDDEDDGEYEARPSRRRKRKTRAGRYS